MNVQTYIRSFRIACDISAVSLLEIREQRYTVAINDNDDNKDTRSLTDKRFKITQFIRTKHNLQIFGVIPLSSYKTTLSNTSTEKNNGELIHLSFRGVSSVRCFNNNDRPHQDENHPYAMRKQCPAGHKEIPFRSVHQGTEASVHPVMILRCCQLNACDTSEQKS